MQESAHKVNNVKSTIPHVSGIETLKKVQMDIDTLRFCEERAMYGVREGSYRF